MIWSAIVAVWRSINWDAATAISTGAAAIFTAVMAWFTRRSIVESHAQYEKTRAQSEQHHQDAYRPVLVLAPQGGVDPVDRSALLDIGSKQGADGKYICSIRCGVQNVGTGSALKVCLHLRAMGQTGYGTSFELTPVAAGERRGDAQHPLWIRFSQTPQFNSADIAFAAGTGWELILEYEDVFGNMFHTIHRKDPRMPWTECGKGPAPAGPV